MKQHRSLTPLFIQFNFNFSKFEHNTFIPTQERQPSHISDRIILRQEQVIKHINNTNTSHIFRIPQEPQIKTEHTNSSKIVYQFQGVNTCSYGFMQVLRLAGHQSPSISPLNFSENRARS